MILSPPTDHLPTTPTNHKGPLCVVISKLWFSWYFSDQKQPSGQGRLHGLLNCTEEGCQKSSSCWQTTERKGEWRGGSPLSSTEPVHKHTVNNCWSSLGGGRRQHHEHKCVVSTEGKGQTGYANPWTLLHLAMAICQGHSHDNSATKPHLFWCVTKHAIRCFCQ